jgi:fructose 1,6-bisphosphatase
MVVRAEIGDQDRRHWSPHRGKDDPVMIVRCQSGLPAVGMFDDPAFDRTRSQAAEVFDYLRRHGPFEPHRLPLDEM